MYAIVGTSKEVMPSCYHFSMELGTNRGKTFGEYGKNLFTNIGGGVLRVYTACSLY